MKCTNEMIRQRLTLIKSRKEKNDISAIIYLYQFISHLYLRTSVSFFLNISHWFNIAMHESGAINIQINRGNWEIYAEKPLLHVFLFFFCGVLYRVLQGIVKESKMFLISGPREKCCRSFPWLVSIGAWCTLSQTWGARDLRCVLHPARRNKLDGRK